MEKGHEKKRPAVPSSPGLWIHLPRAPPPPWRTNTNGCTLEVDVQDEIIISSWPLGPAQNSIAGAGGWTGLVRTAKDAGAGAGGPHLPPFPPPGIASAISIREVPSHTRCRVRRKRKWPRGGRRLRGGAAEGSTSRKTSGGAHRTRFPPPFPSKSRPHFASRAPLPDQARDGSLTAPPEMAKWGRARGGTRGAGRGWAPREVLRLGGTLHAPHPCSLPSRAASVSGSDED